MISLSVSIVYLVANVHPLAPFTFILQLQVLLYGVGVSHA